MANLSQINLSIYKKDVFKAVKKYSDEPLVTMARVDGEFMYDKACLAKNIINTDISFEKIMFDPYKKLYDSKFLCGKVKTLFFNTADEILCENYLEAFKLVYKTVKKVEPIEMSIEFLAQWYIAEGCLAAVLLVS